MAHENLKMLFFVLLVYTILSLKRVEVRGQDVQLLFMGDTIANNSVVSIEDIGVHVSEANTDAVLCMTTVAGCCDNTDVGEWFFPNTMEVLGSGPGGDLYRTRSDTGVVILNRRNAPTSPTGIFHCVIPTQLSPQRVNEDLYVGIYTTSTGAPVLDSLTYDAGSTTLSCTSSGGPATTVLWTRNCLAVGSDDPSFEQTQIVTDTASAVYLNKLTIIAGATDGAYGCSVSNSRGASGSMEIGVGADFEDRSAVMVTITPAANPTAGSPHTLTCDPNSGTASPVQVQWFGPDGNQLQTGGGITVSTQSPFTLTFTQLRESNAGLYVCQATVGTPGSADSGCTSTQVTMQDPTVTVTATGGDAIAGQVFTLMCQASGVTVSGPDDPDLDYSWRRGNTGPELSSFRSYTLAVQVIDAGDDYTCEVTYSPSFLDQSGSVTSFGITTLNVAIRQPTIEIGISPLFAIYYTGLGLTLLCDVDIPGPQLLAVEAEITASGPSGAITGDSRVTVGEVTEDTAGDSYSRIITFSALSSMLDDGMYTCMGTVRPTAPSAFITNGEGTGSRQLNVIDPVFNVALAPITTRVLNVDPYNTFALTCAFSSNVLNMPVNVPKSVQWTRTIGSGPATVVTASTPGVDITDSGLDQSSGSSMLATTAVSAGEHAFECLVRLDVAAVPDDVEAMASTTVTVIGPADPLAVVNLMATAVTHNSATIRWTVPSIAYTPETYVVRYGTTNVNRVSNEMSSGSDISVTDLTLSVQLTGLEQLTEYMYEVQSSSSMGRATTSSRETFMTTNLPPDPPTMLEPTMTADTSFTFTWVAPTVTNGPLTGYQISCSPQLEGIPQSETISVDSTALTGAIAGLFHGVTYTCAVQALNEAAPSEPATVEVTTTTVAPTGSPQNFQGTSHSGGRSIFFNWDPPSATTLNGPISNYTITCTATGTPPVVDVVAMAPATVVGFDPVTEYNCNIFVSNPQGNGPRTTPFVNITTLEGTPDAAPQNVMVEHIQVSPDTVLFSWDPPPAGERNGVIAGYIIACTPTDSGDTRALASNNTSISFDMLQPGTTYGCTFLAFTLLGNGPTAELSLLTLPNQPVITDVTPISSTELIVTWASPGGVIDEFTAYGNGVPKEVTSSSNALLLAIRGFDPFELVDVQVSASNQAGEGPLSEIVQQRTNQDRPGVVSCTNGWVSSSASELVVSWEEPESPNGIITSYYLELHEYQATGAAIATREIIDNSTNTTFSGLMLEDGVPYTISIFAETIIGRGEDTCLSTDFTNQLEPPPVREVVITRSDDQTVIILSWGVPTLREARGFVTYEVRFSSSSAKRTTTRQSNTVCTVSQSLCGVPIEEGGVEVTGADPGLDYTVIVVPVNGEGELGEATTLTAVARKSNTTTVIIVVVVVVVLLSIVTLIAVVLVIFIVKRKQRRGMLNNVDLSEVPTTECAAYTATKFRHVHTTQNEAYVAVKQQQMEAEHEYELPNILATGQTYRYESVAPSAEDRVYEHIQ